MRGRSRCQNFGVTKYALREHQRWQSSTPSLAPPHPHRSGGAIFMHQAGQRSEFWPGTLVAVNVTARVTQSEGWWAIEVPEVSGAFSQARTLGEVPFMAADAVATLLEVPVESIKVTVEQV